MRLGPLEAQEPWLLGLLLLVFSINFISMPALRYDGDAIASEMAAESLVYRGHLSIPVAIAEALPPGSPYFFFNRATGLVYSKYGIGNTLLFALPITLERLLWPVADFDPASLTFGKQHAAYRIDRRILLFNAFNILLSICLATVLYRLAQFYTAREWRAFLFVLACFYSTYLWNYLRAHSSQLFQVLLFSTAMLYLVRFARNPDRPTRAADWDLTRSVCALAALCLVKLVFLPLVAIWGLAILTTGTERGGGHISRMANNLRAHFGSYFMYAGLPVLLLVAILLLVNQIKFGSPWSGGYQQEIHLFGGRISESIPAYLFGARFSIFLHFPLLAIAFAGIPRVWKRHPFGVGVAWVSFLTMFGIYSNYTYWMGEASFGPRYLLFALPVLSLPIVAIFETPMDRGRQLAPILALSLLLLGSSFAQLTVNRLEFHVFYRLRLLFQRVDRGDRELFDYFRDTHSAAFNRDFIRYRRTGELPEALQGVRDTLDGKEMEAFEETLLPQLGSNHYFWRE